MNKNLSVIIADDDTVFPFGLKTILLNVSKKYAIKIAVNGKQVVDMLRQQKADIVFMDYYMPIINGIEAIKIIKKEFPETKIIVCSYCQDHGKVHELIREGIDGYILKEAKRNIIEKAVKVVLSGGEFYADEIKKILQQILDKAIDRGKFETEKNKFTKRELEIIQLVCEKYSNVEIANKLFIEIRTVEAHLYNIYQESGAHNHYELMRYAEKLSLFHTKNIS